MNEVVERASPALDVELAVIPRGTGWDFVRTLRHPARSSRARSTSRCNGRRARSTSAGPPTARGTAASDESLFANIASAGMSGAIAKRANETSKALGGKVSVRAGRRSPSSRAGGTARCASASTARSRSGRMHDVVVANGRYLGGGMMICPEAEPDDGLFDVLLIGDLTKRDLRR